MGLLAVALVPACRPQVDEEIVATVFDDPITGAEYRAYLDGLPQGLRSGKPGIEGHRENLQALIDTRLLLHEARARGLDQSRDFARHLRHERDRRLLQMLADSLRREVRISEEELREEFVASGRNEQIRLAFCRFPDEDAALQALSRLRQGLPWEQLAAERPSAENAFSEAYDPERFFVRQNLHPALRGYLDGLETGDVTEPFAFRGDYYVARIMEDAEAELGRQRQALVQRLVQRRLGALHEELAQRLRRERQAAVLDSGLARLAAAAEQAFSPAQIDTSIVVATYIGGTVRAGHVIDQLHNRRRQDLALTDTAAVAAFVRKQLLPESLLLTHAAQTGYAAAADSAVAAMMDNMLVEELTRREVKDAVEVTYEEAEAFHAENPEIFTRPEQFELQEILVATQAEARELLELLRTDPTIDVDSLADARTLRPRGQGEGGRFHFHEFEGPVYGGLVEAAQRAKPFELQGPIRVNEGYSLFWVLNRTREPMLFEDRRVQFVVRNMVMKIKRNRRFDAFVEQLRGKYTDEVRVYDGNLRAALAGT